MKTRMFIVINAFFIFAPILLAGLSFAEDIKSRMMARVPAIDALKSQGIIGENNQGFLEYLGKDRTGEAIVKEENADRAKVYQAIAAQQGTSADLVGSRRAMQIAEKSKSGHWFEDDTGKWRQK